MSTSSASSSEPPSPSPPQSPQASSRGPPSLERLVVHFVSAKRSLTSASHVYRANELVTSSRTLIEELAALTAKTAFGRKGLDEQVDTLEAIKDAVIDDGDRVANDFAATVAELDKAHLRLDKTLKTLRKTIVEATRSTRVVESQSILSEHEEHIPKSNSQKTLYDFIDEEKHETLLSSLRGLIDSYHFARSDLDNSVTSFEESLRCIVETLSEGSPEHSGPTIKPTIYDEPPPSVQRLFHEMEGHATELASLLENLVKHYDLCVSALKHTEGGGEAARQAVSSQELAKGTPGAEESLYGKTVPEPIADEERHEMLNVLENDAQEVDDVMNEISERASEMEEHYEQLSARVMKARLRHKTLRQVVDMLHDVRATIPTQLDAATRFRETWGEINSDMQYKTKELAELGVFYEEFISGYGELLREDARRQASEHQAKKIVDKARRELEKLYEADRSARQGFMQDVGEFLPRDLAAWHGLEDEAPRWEIRAIPPGELQEEMQ
ncbi:Autophagy-related 17 [Lecanosticta acicola]|uniref:Autophagy-related protein 17 n=1 Tax=Lecanosticta acicola TaxID=111012 RepID=A0AAI8YZB4_9PEZI|nr:Autophagy-related 17 [Lecanosticta acicola]